MPDLHFCTFSFTELSLHRLYQILQLRQEVFVVEQNCPYLDADGKDLQGFHLCALGTEGQLWGYARLLPVGLSYSSYASIGRVVSAPGIRNQGVGRQLMREALQQCGQLFPKSPLKISAQQYLQAFYEDFGFRTVGTGYLEDDIPHIAMVLGDG